MKRILFAFSLVGLLACGGESKKNTQPSEGSVDSVATEVAPELLEEDNALILNAEASTISWIGRKPTEAHNGTIGALHGVIGFSGDQFLHGVVEIDMNSIKVDDIEDEGKNAKLTGHLKNKDFFNVEDFPVATLEILSMEELDSNTVNISSKLIIKGKDEINDFTATRDSYGDSVVYNGVMIFYRTKYDVKYKSKSIFPELGDKFIEDEIQLDFNLVFKQR